MKLLDWKKKRIKAFLKNILRKYFYFNEINIKLKENKIKK